MHFEAYRWAAEELAKHPRPRRVLELGSLIVNGSPRPLFPGAEYFGVDLIGGVGVNLVKDCADPDLPDVVGRDWDVVVCMEVLEHAERAKDIVANAARCLRPGGLFLVTCAGPERAPHSCQGGDELGDEFYRNVTMKQMLAWLQHAGFEGYAAESGRAGQDMYGFGTTVPPERLGGQKKTRAAVASARR